MRDTSRDQVILVVMTVWAESRDADTRRTRTATMRRTIPLIRKPVQIRRKQAEHFAHGDIIVGSIFFTRPEVYHACEWQFQSRGGKLIQCERRRDISVLHLANGRGLEDRYASCFVGWVLAWLRHGSPERLTFGTGAGVRRRHSLQKTMRPMPRESRPDARSRAHRTAADVAGKHHSLAGIRSDEGPRAVTHSGAKTPHR